MKATITYDGVEFEVEYDADGNEIIIDDIRSQGNLWGLLDKTIEDSIYCDTERAHSDRKADEADIKANS